MAFDAYMYFPKSDVEGETQDSAMNKLKAFEISEFSFGAENNISVGSMSGGGGAGKATFKQFTVKKTTDTASTKLFLNLCLGKHFDEAVVELRRSGGGEGVSGATFLKYTFYLVMVEDITWSGSSGDDVPGEDCAFQYGAMKVEYSKQDIKGKMSPAGSAEWSRVLNKSTTKVA
jgi:type VI secretion system secreted protein Hcp